MALIELHGIGHSYSSGKQPREYALHPLDFRVRDGDTCALLGPSGCGKTTLLGIISGLLVPTVGRVHFDGRDVTELPTPERQVAQVFQFPVVYDTMSVHDNLAFPLRNRGADEADIRERVREVAELLELTEQLGLRARGLPAETKQRVSLGRGLVRKDVAAILLDEPLTVVDPRAKWELRRKLRQVRKAFSPTMIYVTHDQSEALTIADRVAVMNAGRIVQEGTPRELFEDPADTFVADFIGSPGMNLVACEVGQGRAQVGGRSFALPPALAQAAEGRRDLQLGIRPEHARLQGREQDGFQAARVLQVTDLGAYGLVTIELGAQTLGVKLPGEDLPQVGDQAWLGIPTQHLRLFSEGTAIA